MDFREQIEQELKKLTPEQQLQFGWRCAIRALPFLGCQGHFDFWEDIDKQQNLYATLRALDTHNYTDFTIASDAFSASNSAEDTAFTAFSIDDDKDLAAAADIAHTVVSAAAYAAVVNQLRLPPLQLLLLMNWRLIY